MIFSVLLIVCCALALMALEAFVPGVSLAGIAGVVLFGIAVCLCWRAFGIWIAVLLAVLCVILSVLVMRVVFRSMKSGKLSKTGVFDNGPAAPAVKKAEYDGVIMPGMTGTAKSALHPSGIAEIERRRVHVVSENGFVDRAERVVVVQVEGAKVIVRKTE